MSATYTYPDSGQKGAVGSEAAGMGKAVRPDRFRRRGNLGMWLGILIMMGGNAPANQDFDVVSLFVRMTFMFGGLALIIWGCTNYMRWKGYSGWFGVFGYLVLLGLLIVACYPNRRKRLLQGEGWEDITGLEALMEEDRKPGYRFLLMLLPLAAPFVILGGLLFAATRGIDPAEWKDVAPAGAGFQALMPGTPRMEQKIWETPAGKVEVRKFIVQPKSEKESFMVVSTHYPERVSRQLDGKEKKLEIGRQDIIKACQGQIQSERQIALGGCPGVELEVLPPGGGAVKARVYATDDSIYEVFVGVGRVRMTSDDVQKFFDSFKLSDEPGAPRDDNPN